MLSNVVSRIHGAQNLKKAMITEIRREISEVENRINSREKKCVDDIEPFAVACVARLVFVFFLVHSAQNAKVSKSRRYRFASESLKDLGINHPRFEDSNGHTYRFFGSAECEAMASLKRKKPTIFDHPSGVMPPFARRVIAEQ
jgi:hypothetical protein